MVKAMQMDVTFSSLSNYLKTCLEDDSERGGTIITAYLFGSYAKGVAKESSDIDLAFLFEEKEYRLNPLEVSSSAHMIAAKIALLIDTEVDVTVLNSASIEMTYEIVTTGVCLYEAESDRRFEYEAKIRGMYFDFKPFLDKLRAQYVHRL